MQQLLSAWSALDMRRRVIVGISTAAMFAAIIALSRMAATPGMSLLYAGLESSAAGEVVSALERRGISYEVRGGSILVDSSQRDELRMILASEGLPANSSAGYELLDNLSGFGTTSQMFDAAYWRAKEGELARTIVSSPYIRNARVHIATPSSKPFRKDVKSTASVTVTTSSGSLSASQAKALKFLVASAVAGMNPDDVAIIDSQGGLILGADDSAATNPNGQSRAESIRKKVERLMEARVGYGNAVVEVSLETVTDQESIVEHRFDPDSRVIISTDTEERNITSEDSLGGPVTVASNLPAGDGGSDKSSSSNNSETRERVNFEVSETKREILKSPGAIKRLTVAVLVNGIRQIDESGTEVFVPRSAEELGELRDLVAASVGFDEARGDVITLKSLEFQTIAEQGSVADPSFLQSLNLDIMSIIQIVVLAVVSLVLGLFVVRPILNSKTTSAVTRLAPSAGAAIPPSPFPENSGANDPASLPALNGDIEDNGFASPAMATVTDFDLPEIATAPMGDLLPGTDGGTGADDPVTRLRNMIEERHEETVEVLREWMDQDEETL